MAAEYEYVPIVYNTNNKKAAYTRRNVSAHNKEAAHNKRNTSHKHRMAYSVYDNAVKRSASGYMGEAVMPASAGLVRHRESAADSPVQSNLKNKGVVSSIFVIVLVFIMLAFVLAGNTQISSVNLENSAIASEISALEEEIEDLKLEITLGEDLGYIEERATELGMSSPDNAHIVYMNGTSDTES